MTLKNKIANRIYDNVVIRSALFVPATTPDRINKAVHSNADAVIIDLEDSVPEHEKDNVIPTVKKKISELCTVKNIIVRINSLQSGRAPIDLDGIFTHGIYGVMLPKVESPSQLSNLHGMLTVLETQIGVKPGKTILFSLVETALGIEKTFDIFSAEIIPTRKIIVALGSADLCLDLGIDMTSDGNELWYPRSRLALGCRAAGIDPPIDSPYLKNIKDKDLIMRDAQNAKKVGFQGKLCIHPIQIDIVNEVFTPSAEDLIFARKVIDAFKNAVEQGNGAIEVDGKMIDQPLVERCRRIVKLCC